MGVTADFDPARLVAEINQIGERATRGVSNIMVDEGKTMQQLAQDFAPRQAPHEGANLEEAIELKVDRSGANRRIAVEVFVNTMLAGKNGKAVGVYALQMEEGLAPYGSGAFKLGKESEQKRAGGKDVGGKYMDRAFRARAEALWRRAEALIDRLLKR